MEIYQISLACHIKKENLVKHVKETAILRNSAPTLVLLLIIGRIATNFSNVGLDGFAIPIPRRVKKDLKDVELLVLVDDRFTINTDIIYYFCCCV